MRAITWRHAVGWLAASLLLSAPALAAPLDDSDAALSITHVDTRAHPEVSVEISAPAIVIGDDLGVDAVEVRENGQVRRATLERVPTAGLEVVLLIDVSGSMNENEAMALAKDAAVGFLAELPAEVPVAVVSFADGPEVVSELTTDRAALEQRIHGLFALGRTALYDAIVVGDGLFSGRTSDRQMVLLSDGGDNVGRTTLDEAVAVAADSRISVIELITSDSDRPALDGIAAAGGGTVRSADDPAALAELYRDVASVLVNRYRLAFTSEAEGPATIEVRIVTDSASLRADAAVTLPQSPPADDPTDPASEIAPGTDAVPGAGADANAPVDGDAVTDDGTPTAPGAVGAPPSDGERGATSERLLWVGAALMFLALLVVAMAVLDGRARRGGVDRRRLAERDPDHAPANHPGFGERVAGGVERLLDHGGHGARLSGHLERAGSALRPGEFLVLVACATLVGALALSSLVGILGVAVALLSGVLVPRWYLAVATERRRRAFAEQLPDVLQLMVSSLRAGYGLPQALEAAATRSDEPARTEFQRVQFEIRIGRDPDDALASAAERMQSREFDWVVAAMAINREIGGELAPVLDNLAATVRERQRLQRQILTLTAEGRVSARVLTVLPVALAGLLALLSPGYFEPMSTSPGPQLVAVAVALMVVGWIWMRRLVRAEL